MPTTARSLLVGLLHKDPAQRFAFAQLSAHAFFANIDWQRLQLKQVAPPWRPSLDSTTDTRHFNVPREDLLRFVKTLPGPKENDPFHGF